MSDGLETDAERRILGQIALLKQEVDRKTGLDEALRERFDGLERAVHNEYAGGPGIGPRVVAFGETREAPPPASSGPSWDWINPGTWWDRAAGERAGESVKVFARLVALGLAVYVVVTLVGYAGRYVDAAERRARAEEESAKRPAEGGVQITVPEGTVLDSADTITAP